MAQAIHESGWLERMPGNNWFGIKNTDRFPGCQYQVTHEFMNGTWEKESLAFEVYPTLEDCFIDHARLITGGFNAQKPNIYAPAFAKFLKSKDSIQFLRDISKYYATDRLYASKLINLLQNKEIMLALAEARAEST